MVGVEIATCQGGGGTFAHEAVVLEELARAGSATALRLLEIFCSADASAGSGLKVKPVEKMSKTSGLLRRCTRVAQSTTWRSILRPTPSSCCLAPSDAGSAPKERMPMTGFCGLESTSRTGARSRSTPAAARADCSTIARDGGARHRCEAPV